MSFPRYSKLEEVPPSPQPLSLALGVFDGIHLGHQAVLDAALHFATKNNGKAGVLTFNPHPVRVIAPQKAPRHLLASIAHKERLLQNLGFHFLIVIPFDLKYADKSAEEFVTSLGKIKNLSLLSSGEDWQFGKNRLGNLATLQKFGQQSGVQIKAIPPVRFDGERISSTRIRQAIRNGNLKDAETMLGRSYSVFGKVIPGDQLGTQLGFPTANIALQNELLPPNGVWKVEVDWGAGRHHAVANLGLRPTVKQDNVPSLEVHVLDFSGELYDQEMEISFEGFIRDEQKFSSLDALKLQIADDVSFARRPSA